MLILRKRYLLLLLINAVILYVIYIQRSPSDELIFNSNYVIDILNKQEELAKKVNELQEDNRLSSATINGMTNDITTAHTKLKLSQNELQACQNQQQSLRDMSNQQAIERKNNQTEQQYLQEQCSDIKVELTFAKKQIVKLQKQNQLLQQTQSQELSNLKQQLVISEQALVSAEKHKHVLAESVKTLQSDLVSPIYIKTLYVTPKYCEGAVADEYVCFDKILLLPRFSKTPTGEIKVSIKSPNNKILAELTYNGASARVVSFTFDSKMEYINGDYEFIFNVDQQQLIEKYRFAPPKAD